MRAGAVVLLFLMAAGCAVPRSPRPADSVAGELRAWLGQGHDPNEFDADGLTPLHRAARDGAVEAMALVIAAGADLELRDARSTGWPPLMHAIHGRQPAAVRLLLERGADPNVRLGGTSLPNALLMAAAEPDPVFVGLLLAHGANPRLDGHNGAHVLTVAVSGGALKDIERPLLGGCHVETVRALMTHDPALRLTKEYGPSRGARLLARLRDCSEVLKLVGE